MVTDRVYTDASGYEHRYQQHDHAGDETVECAYCGAQVSGCDSCPVPPAGDDEAWGELAGRHAAGCEWIETRAHRQTTAS
jgi:hypothetical protein